MENKTEKLEGENKESIKERKERKRIEGRQ
jgi:hypothetical protein